jgi:hypothetical protein
MFQTEEENFMATRYATIIPNDEGQEVVSNVAQIEGSAPQVSFGKVEKVHDGVLIGMIRGGTVNAVGGFGFPEGTTGTEGRADLVAKANAEADRRSKRAKENREAKAEAKADAKANAGDTPADPPADPAKADA